MHLLTKENSSALAKMPGCVRERIVFKVMDQKSLPTCYSYWKESCGLVPQNGCPAVAMNGQLTCDISIDSPIKICFDSDPCPTEQLFQTEITADPSTRTLNMLNDFKTYIERLQSSRVTSSRLFY